MIGIERQLGEMEMTPEGESISSIGVILIVVAGKTLDGESPMVSTLIELQGKPETGKTAGQISFPAETRKVGESERSTLIGALAELTDSDSVVERLLVVPEMFYARGVVSIRGRSIDVAFMVYDGPIDEEMQPIDPTETRSNGWLPLKDIQLMNGEVRGIAHDSIHFATTWGILGLIQQHRAEMVPLTDFLEPDFSLREFIQRRDPQADIPLS